MRKSLLVSIALLLSVTSVESSIGATKPVSGKACAKAGTTSTLSGSTFHCVKSGKKLIWMKASPVIKKSVVTPTPTPSPTASAVPIESNSSTSGSLIPAINSVQKLAPVPYATTVTAESDLPHSKQIPVPTSVSQAPSGTNVKLWIADPRELTKPLAGSGIFYWGGGQASAQFAPMSPDGTLFLTLATGKYSFDTVEGSGLASIMTRHRYALTVNSDGTSSIDGLTADSRGFFGITTDLPTVNSVAADKEMARLTALATEPANTFTPTSACQLADAITPNRSFSTDLSAGFPKVRVRLPAYGHIKALIVPIDFTDIQGRDNTVTYFTPVANGVRDFYYSQSYGRVAFDFSIVPNWVHAPFSSTKFGTGGSVGAGDPDGYLKAVIALTDPAIDYSKYDAVYFLVPKEMPMANMGWGPAITSPHPTSTGVIINGATGGADMYFNEDHGIVGGRWKWMAHETGHAFGLYDEDNNHQSASLGNWDIMAMSWSNEAIELGAWDRYLQGWLTTDQIGCTSRDSLTTTGKSFTINPLVRQDNTSKAIMIPLSATKILVMESRHNEGLDSLTPSQEGLIVYTVDMSLGQLKGGYIIQPRTGSSDKGAYRDAALHAGDSITVDGIKITVTASTTNGESVLVGI